MNDQTEAVMKSTAEKQDASPYSELGRPLLTVVTRSGQNVEVEDALLSSPNAVTGMGRGAVLCWKGNEMDVECENNVVIHARQADGCLMRPEPGDLVLFHAPEYGKPGAVFVLHVLEKTSDTARLHIPGKLHIQSEGAMQFQAPDMLLQAEKTTVASSKFHVLADSFSTKAGQILTTAASMDNVIGELTQKICTSVREVETEVVRAGGLRQFIRNRFLVRAGRASVIAEDDVTVDGEKVHLG
ncbi:DUF3540 domain-containing protein [Desulfovibrio inopinatus]|uniref:DUF3540 domain-containing protein n=1 Tax=Desulfovibrio inopinatus TaxID=102109 RepID=UPI0003FF92D7|nr:DUF3540 domain-containing protein [Desulfovibrio inopinatus]